MNKWLQWQITAFLLVLGLAFCTPYAGIAQQQRPEPTRVGDAAQLDSINNLKEHIITGKLYCFDGDHHNKKKIFTPLGATIVIREALPKRTKKELNVFLETKAIGGGYTDQNGSFSFNVFIDPSKEYVLHIWYPGAESLWKRIWFLETSTTVVVEEILEDGTIYCY